jgi:hypothetical protein
MRLVLIPAVPEPAKRDKSCRPVRTALLHAVFTHLCQPTLTGRQAGARDEKAHRMNRVACFPGEDAGRLGFRGR